MIASWSIQGAEGQPILGNSHLPNGEQHGVILLCHGFKGYKDYGFFPQLAQAVAQNGLIAHRFNFSHSGMTDNIDTFERADLFAGDTWSKQVFDLQQVTASVKAGRLPGDGRDLPMTWFGHSRGGVTVLLTASRQLTDGPDRVMAAAAPHLACHLNDDERQLMRSQGYIESPSSRTGQVLRIGKTSLDEIEGDPDAFDPIKAVAKITSPLLLIHGDSDETVAVESSQRLQRAGGQRATLLVIEGASHTFNAPNPLALGDTAPGQTKQLLDAVVAFALGGRL